MNSFELQAIAGSGGGLVLDAKNYNAFELQSIAEKMTAPLIIKNGKKFNSFECQRIAKKNPGRVIFDFSDHQ